MKIVTNFVILLSLIIQGTLGTIDLKMNHEAHLPDLNQLRHPLEPNQKQWVEARNYIERSFETSTLHTEVQMFKTTIATPQNSLVEIEGQNIIGHSMSSNEKAPVILVGCYYDSTLKRNPLSENGASVASMLEIARLFQAAKQTNKLAQNITVLFVAFDLNVKNYVPLGPGLPGSHYLAKEWLPQYLSGRQFLGALLLDSISSFNAEPNSQRLLPGYEVTFSMAYKEISDSGFKGDFIGVTSRSDDSNKDLKKRFQKSYGEVTSGGVSQLTDFELRDGVSIGPSLLDSIKRGPQFDFWTNSLPLPAMLISDMGTTRKDFDEEKCKVVCTVAEFWSATRKTFVEATTASVIEMLLYYETTEAPTDAPPVDLDTTTAATTPAPENPNAATVDPGNKATSIQTFNVYVFIGPWTALFWQLRFLKA